VKDDPLTRFEIEHEAALAALARLEQLAQIVGSLEANPAQRYVSPSDASMSTWRDYGTGPPFGIPYYFQGQVLGALLDLSILHDTRGQRGLDDVMRALYRDFYERHRGFTPSDLIGTVSTIAGRDYEEFFRRYVTGVEAPDHDRILGHAGVRMRRPGRERPYAVRVLHHRGHGSGTRCLHGLA
jgi:predicted metalloprotease with PDZ domain